jgi:hypothetical protein
VSVPPGATHTEISAFAVADLFVAITDTKKAPSLVNAAVFVFAAGLTMFSLSIAAMLNS